ncbi:hypothetical protein [Curtobacterium sp. 9128]|uniref:hypothetical protein n=1 Tax=Curtobacterium sp. 9128 TaxID=1793722 RepID=UPI0011A55810|nr:hypothetical protein [Curtobacterium sp. 9128]
MHDQTPPLRFRTPPGWPTPSPEWTELFQGAEPAPGWSPAADVPPAPSGWPFWRPTRALRRRVPRSSLVLLVVGAALAIVSFAGVAVLWTVDGPAALALAPMVAGIALWIVGANRYRDGIVAAWDDVRSWSAARRAEQRPEDPAAWDAAAWSVPDARPFEEGPPSRIVAVVNHALVVSTAVVATLVLVAGATIAAQPAVDVVAQAVGDGSALADDSPQPEWSSDDGSIQTYWLAADDEWEATCDMTPGDSNCDAYEIDSDTSCTAIVTVGFFASADDDQPSRVEERAVSLTEGIPLVLVENYDEEISGIGDVSCATGSDASGDRVTATQEADDHVADADTPAGCDEEDCVAFAVTPSADCDAATVQFEVDAAIGSVTAPHDLAVVTPLDAGKATDVFVGGTDRASDVLPGQVTCRASSDGNGDAQDS